MKNQHFLLAPLLIAAAVGATAQESPAPCGSGSAGGGSAQDWSSLPRSSRTRICSPTSPREYRRLAERDGHDTDDRVPEVNLPGGKAEPLPPEKDQAYWSGRIGAARARARTQQDVPGRPAKPDQRAHDGLRQSRRSGAARAARARTSRALAELDRVKKEIAEQTQAITDIEEEARGRCPAGMAALSAAPILLVEDKDSLRAMLRHALESQGHQVVEARDQTEAIDPSAANAARRGSLGRLPVGDGFGVLKAAKDVDPELPVIVMTAFGGVQDAVAAMKEGALDFAKPVDPDHCCCSSSVP